MKKYEQKQIDPDLTTSYKFSIKTGPGQYSGTNSEVRISIKLIESYKSCDKLINKPTLKINIWSIFFEFVKNYIQKFWSLILTLQDKSIHL